MTSSGRRDEASPQDGVSPYHTHSHLDAHPSPGLCMQDYVDVEDADLSSELIRRLRHLERFVSPEEMGEIWIFPPLQEPEGTREFVLFTRMDGDEVRQVYSARDRGREERARTDGRRAASEKGEVPEEGAAESNGAATSGTSPAAGSGEDGPGGSHDGAHPGNGGPSENGAGRADQAIVAHGRAPAGRLPGLVESLLRRLGDQRAPVHVAIEGSRRRWDELVTRLGQDAGTAAN